MRIRRWFIYRDAGALHIERGAAPNCPDCNGRGMWWTNGATEHDDPDEVLCACVFGPHVRIRYRPRAWAKQAPTNDPWSNEPPF